MEATADSLDIPNPWTAPSAAIINASDLDVPVDPKTGASGYLASLPAERRDYVRNCAWHKESLDAQLYKLGAKFLAASIAPSYGIMPGSGLHLEVFLLHRTGLTPREALAAATTNYADLYGWKDVGRIEPGRLADIVILDADPRVDTAALDHIDKVILGGTLIDRGNLLITKNKS
jgi:imidazolonepropionase-like amidohydrolase